MSTELVTFSDEQVLLIKNQICPGITDPELQLFITQCKRTGLDPFSKQVYAVKRWDSKTKTEKMAIQFSIDGFRVIAERTGKYAGQLGPFWCGEDGAWREVWIDVNPPVAAKVGILRKDFQEPLWGVAKFDTYAQRDKDGNLTRFWRMMPEVMIAKCAESVGLRRAFPQDLSGCYTSDEMGQADVVDVEVAEPRQQQAPKAKKLPPPVEAKPAVTYPHFSKERVAAEPDAAAINAEIIRMTAEHGRDAVVKLIGDLASKMKPPIPPGPYTGELGHFRTLVNDVAVKLKAGA